MVDYTIINNSSKRKLNSAIKIIIARIKGKKATTKTTADIDVAVDSLWGVEQ